jgi:hypothetical protein
MNSKAKNWQGMGRVQKNFCSAAENSIAKNIKNFCK